MSITISVNFKVIFSFVIFIHLLLEIRDYIRLRLLHLITRPSCLLLLERS